MPSSSFDRERKILADAQTKGPVGKFGVYARLSGPGWLQSAITLGGGSLAASLYLGVVGGVTFLWLQPLAMILGIIMLSGIAHVTLSTQQRPFGAINQHVSPVLGWSWALASLAANIFWCMPQYALADNVLQQNLLPGLVGPDGSIVAAATSVFGADSPLATNAGKVVIAGVILIVTTIITWFYNSGNWGIRLYETILKLMVAGIVLCFVGVVWALRASLPWREIGAGFLPDLSKLFEPSDAFQQILQTTTHSIVWTKSIVAEQRGNMIAAAATAVGINMTFLFPYSLLRKKWTREFRGLTIFDLATGMLIPFVLATSCVVIASANRFHTNPAPGLIAELDADGNVIQPAEKPSPKTYNRYYELLAPVLRQEIGREAYGALVEKDAAAAKTAGEERPKGHLGAAIRRGCDALEEADRRIAAMLVRRDAFDLAKALTPLTGDRVANVIFGLGVLGMTLSTITILMLISGFVICEMFNLPEGGWAQRIACLAAATGVLGPFIWSKAQFYLAIYVSAFGMMLLPLAYVSFLLLMNQKKLLGDDMPTGRRRFWWNLLMGIATVVVSLASIYTLWKGGGWWGVGAFAGVIVLALVVRAIRGKQ